jgi:hypothetical protein
MTKNKNTIKKSSESEFTEFQNSQNDNEYVNSGNSKIPRILLQTKKFLTMIKGLTD